MVIGQRGPSGHHVMCAVLDFTREFATVIHPHLRTPDCHVLETTSSGRNVAMANVNVRMVIYLS